MRPEDRFSELLADDASRPFVTYYDEQTGERSELSRKSLANWVVKTRYLIGDELGLGVGDVAVLALPAHWISIPVVLGCLCAGLELRDSGDGDVGFAAPGTVAAIAHTTDRYVIAPQRAAVGLGDDVPDGSADYVAAVRPQADAWAGISLPATTGDPALDGLSRGDAMQRAAERASELGVAAGGRLLTARDWTGAADWIDTVLVPLSAGGSVVFVRNAPDDAVLDRRAEQERATARF